MPYRLTHFSPGLVQVEVTGHIETGDVEAMREEGELALRHIVDPFDAIIDATGFTGLNPLALAQLRSLPLPPQVRAVAVVLGGWQLLASKALPRIDGLVFVGSVEDAHAALVDAPPLALTRAGGVASPEAARPDAQPVEPQPPAEPLPQIRRLPTRPLPAAHRATASGEGITGGILRSLAVGMNAVSERLERLGEP